MFVKGFSLRIKNNSCFFFMDVQSACYNKTVGSSSIDERIEKVFYSISQRLALVKGASGFLGAVTLCF